MLAGLEDGLQPPDWALLVLVELVKSASEEVRAGTEPYAVLGALHKLVWQLAVACERAGFDTDGCAR